MGGDHQNCASGLRILSRWRYYCLRVCDLEGKLQIRIRPSIEVVQDYNIVSVAVVNDGII